MTGLTACGGDDTKIKDEAFVTECKKQFDDNAQLKAYGADICGCVQDELVKSGHGDDSEESESLKDDTVTATTKCTREALSS
jgi:hypothetical protein